MRCVSSPKSSIAHPVFFSVPHPAFSMKSPSSSLLPEGPQTPIAVHDLEQGKKRCSAIRIQNGQMVFGSVSSATVLDNYRVEIMAHGIQSGCQNAYGRGNAGYQYRVDTEGPERLIQVSLEEGAEAAFGQKVVAGPLVELSDDRCTRGLP